MQFVLAGLLLVLGAESFRRARREGTWSWTKFAWVLAAALMLAGVGTLLALALARYGRDHPGIVTVLVMIVLLGGVVGITVVAKKRSTR
jgi:hypothetical protein